MSETLGLGDWWLPGGPLATWEICSFFAGLIPAFHSSSAGVLRSLSPSLFQRDSVPLPPLRTTLAVQPHTVRHSSAVFLLPLLLLPQVWHPALHGCLCCWSAPLLSLSLLSVACSICSSKGTEQKQARKDHSGESFSLTSCCMFISTVGTLGYHQEECFTSGLGGKGAGSSRIQWNLCGGKKVIVSLFEAALLNSRGVFEGPMKCSKQRAWHEGSQWVPWMVVLHQGQWGLCQGVN